MEAVNNAPLKKMKKEDKQYEYFQKTVTYKGQTFKLIFKRDKKSKMLIPDKNSKEIKNANVQKSRKQN